LLTLSADFAPGFCFATILKTSDSSIVLQQASVAYACGSHRLRWGMPVLENAQSVAHRPLPPIPPGLKPEAGTLVLFYQYTEPSWTPAEHKKALSTIIGIAEKNQIMGRGRVAPEGLNCTLTGSPREVRAFCDGLRAWNPLFNNTDFKLTDGLE